MKTATPEIAKKAILTLNAHGYTWIMSTKNEEEDFLHPFLFLHIPNGVMQLLYGVDEPYITIGDTQDEFNSDPEKEITYEEFQELYEKNALKTFQREDSPVELFKMRIGNSE